MKIAAREIMTTPVISVTEEMTLKELAELLSKNRFSGVPVVDAEQKVIGILSDTDIVRYSHQVNVVPFSDLSGWISPYTDITDIATVRKGMDQLSKTTVGKVMTRKVFTATEDTDIHEVAKVMNRRKINRVPVVDGSGKLVGIITRADMVNYLALR